MADFNAEPPSPSVNPNDFLVPGSGAPVSTLKPIDPNAQLKLAARPPESDPFAGWEEVTSPARTPEGLRTIDPHAKEKLAAQTKATDPFAGWEEADPFAGWKSADVLDVKDVPTLADDDTFHPADYLAANPNLRTDEAKSKKLIDVYRARQLRGPEVAKIAKAAVHEAPGIVGKTLLGARDLATRAIELGIQPAATSALATITGATPEEKSAIMAEQGKQQLKAASEVTAGTESALTGLAQIAQQGGRKLQHLFGKPVSKLSDSELLDQLYLDAEFSKTTKEVSEGRGDAAKAVGLDADTLAKNGVTLDKDAIERLSLVDPLTLVATAGAFKVVGLGGKVIATAATKAGAQVVIDGLSKVAQTVGAKGIEVVGKTAGAVGKTGQALAERLPAKSVGFIIGAAKGGSLQAGAIGAAAGEAAKRIGFETAGALANRGARVAELGSQLNPGFVGPKSAGIARLLELPSSAAGKVATGTLKGAVQGAVTALPLAAATDESQTAGALLGGGAALGAIHGAATGTKAAVAETVAKNYLDPHNIPFEPTNSPGYGVDKSLDASHDAAIAKLPENEQNAVNTFREAVRAGGGEIYVQDAGSYLNRIRENLTQENGGKPLTPEQEAQAKLYADTHAFFDGMVPDKNGENRRVVFLNSDSTGLHHDAGHLFQSLLSPENQAALRESALKSYSSEQLDAFKQEYARRIGEPDYFSKLGDEANNKAADELIAENFGQLFQNKTFSELSAPKSFLKKLGDVAVKSAEALGLDLTAGRKTADLGVTPSLRLQDLLRNAAQDVLTREPKTPKAPVEPTKLKMVQPEDVKPAEVAKPEAVTPEAVAPKKVTPAEILSPTAKNIRVERTEQEDFASKRAEETGISEAQKATESNPEVRKVVDDIAKSMEAGNPVLEVEHRGIVSERGPAAPEGRTSRRGTQEAGYQELQRLQVENRAEAPADIVDTHQKTFVPVRFTTQGGKPTLIAMSLDKVIANVRRVVKDAVSKTAESLLPYPVENGKLTDAGWKQAIEDIKSYAENQSNGYRGDGQKLIRPTEDIGVSLPAENPNYTPKKISESAMNFANLVQGLNPPETGRVQKGLTPGNVKGQLLAEINKKQPLTPAIIKPEHVTKQEFKGFEPRKVAETNPLRNELAARGVKVRELTEVTERLAVQDIASVKPRPDINFKAPATDTIRAGFLPGNETEKALKSGLLPDTKPSEPTPSAEIRSLATNYAKNAGIDYKPARVFGAIDPELSKRLADFYDAAKSNPADPAVRASYDALAKETLDQYKSITNAGYKIEPFTGEGEPYPNSAATVSDIRDNKHLYFFQTDKAFGRGTESSTNPMLADSGVVINGQKLPVNDIFRAVHDFFGHGKEGYQFGPRGELNAWRAHSEMFSPEAQGAFAAETLAQNSWVNFGKHLRDASGNIAVKGEKNYVPPADRPFGEQKNVVVPQELIDAARKSAGESPKFLPGDKPVSELGPEIAKMSADEWKTFTESNGGHLTPEAYKLGLGLTDAKDLELLRRFQSEHDAKGSAALKTGDFGTAMTEATKSQFFREAAEAATDTGSAANPRMGWRKVLPDAKPPFATQSFADRLHQEAFGYSQEKPKFLPRTEAGKKVAEKGFDITVEGNLGIRSAVIRKGDKVVGKIVSSSPDNISEASINFADVSPKLRGQGLGEAAYRELLTQLKEDGVKDVTGITVAGQPLAIREKIFGKGSTEITDPEGLGDRGKIPVDQAIDELKSGGLGFNARNKITPESKFLPKTKPQSPFTKKLLEDTGWKFSRTDFSHSIMFKLEDGKKFVGDLQIFLDQNVKNFAEVGAVETDSGYRGKGAAEALYREAANVLQDRGVTRLGGDFLNQAPLNLRKKVFGDFEQLGDDTRTFSEEEARSRLPETPPETLDEAPGQRTGKVYGVSTVNPEAQFLPKKRILTEADVRKRDEKGRPLTKGGLVDYEKLYAEKTKAAKVQEAADLKSIEGKYTMPLGSAPKAGRATGWILPDKKFVPIEQEYHENFLSDNAAELNADFGTTFKDTPDIYQRLDAVNQGFVRMRYTPNDGGIKIEAGAAHWNSKTKQAILDQIEKHADNIDKLDISILNQKGLTIDSASERVFDLPPEEKISVAKDVLEGLKVSTAKPGNLGPTDIQRARAFGQSSESKYLPSEKTGEKYVVVWKPRAAGKTTFRNEVTASSIEDAKSQVIPPGGHLVDAFTSESVNKLASSITPELVKGLETQAKKEAGGAKFLPRRGTKEFNDYVDARIKESRKDPESLPLEFRKDEKGNYRTGFNDEPVPVGKPYDLAGTYLAKKLKGNEAAFVDTLSKRLESYYQGARKNPEIQAGEKWYSTCREKLQSLLGEDTKLFAELLGATSPQTSVDVNFRYSLDAYNQFKRGAYDKILEKYREGKDAFDRGDISEFSKETGKTGKKATREAFLNWWVDKYQLIPESSGGKRFGFHSRAVLKVFDRSWLENVKGPKTPNFTGNLTGDSFKATIDVWAMRTLHRLANEGNPKRWRIPIANEVGVSENDFFTGQKAFQKVANRAGIQADALQALLWFAEKDYWASRGWTVGSGKAKSDFNSLLQATVKTPGGFLKRATPQGELNLGDEGAKKK